MTALSTTIDLVAARDRAQQDIDSHLAPSLAKYKEFLLELNPSQDCRDLEADTFLETDREFFSFVADEEYSHGDYYTPSLNLPFAFVEDPEAYSAKARQDEADRKAKATARTAKDTAERVERLKAQLAKAQAELDKAEQGTDEIKIVATQNLVASLSR